MTSNSPRSAVPPATRALAGLVFLAGWAVTTAAQTQRATSFASGQDYLFVCRADSAFSRCVEVLRWTDLRSSATTTRLNYYEFDLAGPDSRGLSCAVPSSALAMETSGPRLRQAVVSVTVVPESAACLGSWGIWPPGPMSFSLTMTPSGDFAQQSRGHGVVQFADAGFRFSEALESWSVNATGAIDTLDFGGGSGNIQTVRRTDITRVR